MLNLSHDEIEDIILEEHADFITVEDIILDHSRWTVERRLVVQNIANNKFYVAYYETPATEHQEVDNSNLTFIEVTPVKVETTSYVKVL